MNQVKIGVGSMRMDKGESLQYAYDAIERIAPLNPEYYTFDIIYVAKEDSYIAETYIKLIKKRVTERIPNATTFFGTTDNFWVRPGAQRLFELGIITKEDIVGYKDINPNREKSW